LWLRTANRGRPLTKLANKIKVGNSLIDDKNVVPNAFDWHVEFSEVFAQGGFDVVIGNPPYVRNTSLSKDNKDSYGKNYYVADGQYDLYVLFNELALKLTKFNGLIGFIQPNKFISADYGVKTINFIFHNSEVELIKNVSLDKTFEDASVYPYILILHLKIFQYLTYVKKRI
jgi:methylase of polypeptide subunit release factors